jgi:hypothetical protein
VIEGHFLKVSGSFLNQFIQYSHQEDFSGGGIPGSMDARNLGSRNSKPIHMAGVEVMHMGTAQKPILAGLVF